MTVTLDHIRFDLPPGFEDESNYTFRSETDSEELDFSVSNEPPEHAKPSDVIADREGQLRDVYSTSLKVISKQTCEIANRPAQVLVATIEEKAISTNLRLGILALQGSKYFEVSYIAGGAVNDIAQRWAAVLSNLKMEPESVASVPGGFVRRPVGMASAAVPSKLHRPARYSFLSRHPDIRAEVSLILLDGSDSDALELHQVESNAGEAGHEPKTVAVRLREGAASVTERLQKRSDDREGYTVSVDAILSSRVRILMTARAPDKDRSGIQELTDQFLKTLSLRR